ncbi:MAG: ribonuclease D [Eggerthellaceae bacterium]|nr:ribonuclease D [Eggerthellaceae bacterium]
MLLTTQTQLHEFVEHARTSPILAIDTEFLREKTYWPKLCLLQLGTYEHQVAIDPFQCINLEPLKELFLNKDILKIVHAGTQDLEIIFHELHCVPTPIFDTQIAATLLGNALQIGYAALVQSFCSIKLKKEDSYTDWSMRPLTNSQITYALNDVKYLPQIYDGMREQLESLGRLEWLRDDFLELENAQNYEPHPMQRYLKLKRVNQLYGTQLACAQRIAAWREERAVTRNVPRKFIMSDEQIIEICKREPKTLDDLFMVRGVSRAVDMDDARELLQICIESRHVPDAQIPRLPRLQGGATNVDAQVDFLSAFARKRARENNVAFAVLVSQHELAQIARGHLHNLEVLKGWRKTLVGDDLVRLAQGKLSISLRDGDICITEISR